MLQQTRLDRAVAREPASHLRVGSNLGVETGIPLQHLWRCPLCYFYRLYLLWQNGVNGPPERVWGGEGVTTTHLGA